MKDIKLPKKLIEVALPLDDINAAAAKEKSVRHGHPSNMHRWWARRPLAAARAVLFAQLVNDPGRERGYFAGKTKAQADKEREELFDIIRDLVKWENTDNKEVLGRAHEAIKKSWLETCELNKGSHLFNPDSLPAFHDPFAGGGGLPLESQRLGLETFATDLNPVAVLINKAMIEIPPRFHGQKPIGPVPKSSKSKSLLEQWDGNAGLIEDISRYGQSLLDKAKGRLGYLYPDVLIDECLISRRPDLKPYLGKTVKPISWVWARSVYSPNPAYSDCKVPLAKSFVLSRKKGKETYLEVLVDGKDYSFEVKKGSITAEAKTGTKASRGANFTCVLSGSPIDSKYIKNESASGRMDHILMAVVCEGNRERVYLSPNDANITIDVSDESIWLPELEISGSTQYVGVAPYGISKFSELFSKRQAYSLTVLCDLLSELKAQVVNDGLAKGLEDDGIPLEDGGRKLTAYADAIAVYMALTISKLTDSLNTLCPWEPVAECSRQLFNRQAISMAWEFAEGNVLGKSSGSFSANLKVMLNALRAFPEGELVKSGVALNRDATTQEISSNKVISTDPPYFDNVPYADISDFFYVWLRKALRGQMPSLFGTMGTPKSNELVAFAYRHKDKGAAAEFFMNGMTEAMRNLAQQAHPAFPVTIYYAFKQSDTDSMGTSSTGWETFLEAVIRAGFEITGTWPMRTELNAALKTTLNTLASSVVLVCRKRPSGEVVSRRHFQKELRDNMPDAIEIMIGGEKGSSPISPVDLAQSAIGPGMAIFSQYESVLNQDGSRMSVHDALVLINRSITDYLNPDSGNFDADTLFCDDWFAQFGWGYGEFGSANTLAQAKGTSVDGVKEAGVIESGGGKVKLLKWSEYPTDWDPKNDTRTPVWEACHQLIRSLNQQGQSAAGALLARMPEQGEPIRQLAYHLYTLCERKKWAEEARAYNELIASWHDIVAASHEAGHKDEQIGMEF